MRRRDCSEGDGLRAGGAALPTTADRRPPKSQQGLHAVVRIRDVLPSNAAHRHQCSIQVRSGTGHSWRSNAVSSTSFAAKWAVSFTSLMQQRW